MTQPGFAQPFNLKDWIERNRQFLKPPVSNRLLFDDKSGLVIQIIGGGNRRTDYHVDPAQEFFYQLKGDMILKVHDGASSTDVRIREGDVFLLPGNIAHSPQRPDPESIGIVVEGPRVGDETDAFEWYCFNCGSKVARVDVQVTDIVKDLPPLFEAFYADTDRRTCKQCGEIHPGNQVPAGWAVL